MKKESMGQKKYSKGTPVFKAGTAENQGIPSAKESLLSRRTFLKMTSTGMTVALEGWQGL